MRIFRAMPFALSLSLAAWDASADSPSTHDTQETNPSVGLFRLPAHRGEAEALAGPEGFGFLSHDNDFGMMLHPVLQADARYELGTLKNEAQRSQFLVAFAGLALTARFYERVRAELLVSFSGSAPDLLQGWLDADIAPWLHIKVGEFPSPLSFERSTASIFFPLVAADLVSALLPSVDTGLEVWGAAGRSTLEYSVAFVNGAVPGAATTPQVDANKDVVGRVTVSPFADHRGPGVLEGLVVGVGGSIGSHTGTSANPELPSFATWAGETYFSYLAAVAQGTTAATPGATATGGMLRLVPQASWHAGPLSAYAELARTLDHVNGALVESSAWSVVMTAVLTGERALPLHYVIPTHNLDARTGSPGAFELVGSAGVLDVRDDGQLAARVAPTASMRGARTFAGGLNWYPNLGVRVMLDAEHTTFVPLSGRSAFPDETLLVGRFQVVL